MTRRQALKFMAMATLLGMPLPALASEADSFPGFLGRMILEGRLSRDEQTSWLAQDLTTGKTLLSINPDVPRQCASMVKPYLALAFFHLVKEGRLSYDPKSQTAMARMLRESDNAAANWFFRIMGSPRKVQGILDSHYSRICKSVSIVEEIPPGGKTYKNMASASDHNRLLKSLHMNELPYSQEIKKHMAREQIINEESFDVSIKNGFTARLCGQMCLYQDKERDFACSFVGIVQRETSAEHYRDWKIQRLTLLSKAADFVLAQAMPSKT